VVGGQLDRGSPPGIHTYRNPLTACGLEFGLACGLVCGLACGLACGPYTALVEGGRIGAGPGVLGIGVVVERCRPFENDPSLAV